MGQRLMQITRFAANRPLQVTGRLGQLESSLRFAVQEVLPIATGPLGKVALVTGDGRSLLELYEEEIAQVIPDDSDQSLRLLMDGGTELILRLQPSAPL